MDKLDFSGIEVSAQELVVALQREGKRKDLKTFPNPAAGHQALIRHLSCLGGTVRAVLESTGLYGLDLALALRRAGIEVMVANPRAVRHFAQALMQRSKNDRLDARVLLEFATRMPWPGACKRLPRSRRPRSVAAMPCRPPRPLRPLCGATWSAVYAPTAAP